MKHLLTFLLTTSLFLTSTAAKAQNPYLPLGEFIPDGEPYVFDDPDRPGHKRVYVYGSHDNLITEYCGKDQVVWSAPIEDLKHWRYDGIIFESKLDAQDHQLHPDGSGDVLFAPDVTCRLENGKPVYYLYPNNQAGGRNGMVAKSDRPDGPFKVCNWTPNNPTSNIGILGFDPAVFVDDDGRVYGYWGFHHSNGAELDPITMSTVKEGTKIVEDMIPGYEQDKTFRFFEASSIRKIKDKYVYIYSRWTNEGEFGLWESNYTLAYCYSNNPLGPWIYGGTIIDGRARENAPDGSTIATACPNGNTHGSICEINGKWYVFYHRQASTNEYCRQAMVAPIDVEVMEGPTGYVRISEAEYTSEGFATEGLDPFTRYSAGIACYYVGSEPSHAEYPNVVYPGSHTAISRINYSGIKNPYDYPLDICPMVNNNDGSSIGYKYFNFSQTYGCNKLQLELNIKPESEGSIDIYLDRPTISQGGVKIGTIEVSSTSPSTISADVPNLKFYNGKHALFLVFRSITKGKSICQLNTLQFKSTEKSRVVEDGGTGDYKAIMREFSSLPAHTVFYPQDLSKFSKSNPLPVLVWGNGACTNSPWEHFKFLNEIASHGYLVIATGYIPMREVPYHGDMSTPQQQIQSIDWAITQNKDKSSPFYGKINVKAICASGMSCGGLQTLFNCTDKRITTYMICNSGLFIDPKIAMPNMPMPGKDQLKSVHAPIIYILGGESDIAYQNGMDDFHRIQHVPAVAINYPVGHGGTYRQPHGGEFSIPAIAWLNWQLKGDLQSAKMFTGSTPLILQRPKWAIETNSLLNDTIVNMQKP